MSSGKLNKQFLLLKFFSIVFVVLGHVKVSYLQLNYITYYSFHIPLFMFMSGYFLREEVSVDYYASKIKKLLIPFLGWHIIYLCVQTILSTRGYTLGNALSLYNLFIFPFKHAQPIGFNISSWFIVTLIGVLIVDAIMRKILHFSRYREGVLFVIYFICSAISLYLRIEKHVSEEWINVLKIIYMLPYFQLGKIYKLYLEDNLKLPTWPTLVGVWLSFYGLNLMFQNLDYGVYNLVLPSKGIVTILLTYVTAVLGIVFWLHVSKLFVPILGDLKFVRSVAQSSYAIMMHHLFVIFLFQFVLRFLFRNHAWFQGFDHERFKGTVYYIYDFQKDIRFIYAVSSIVIITYLSGNFRRVKNAIKAILIGG